MIAGLSFEAFLLLQVLIALGCYIQNTTGFALALVVIIGVVLFDIMPLPPLMVALGFMMLINGGTSLFSEWHFVNKRALLQMAVCIMPTIILGVYTLDMFYATNSLRLLQVVLGIVIVIASFLLFVSPTQKSTQSSPLVFVFYGMIGGMMAGMFASSAPPLVYLTYRQPWHIDTIRNTLLAIFTICATIRIGVITYNFGHFPIQEFILALYCFPVVFIATKFAQWHAKKIPLPWVKKGAFAILIISGLRLIFW